MRMPERYAQYKQETYNDIMQQIDQIRNADDRIKNTIIKEVEIIFNHIKNENFFSTAHNDDQDAYE